jgi:serine/threonine protein kinase/tetratricopeptide (TPR) repeat protein
MSVSAAAASPEPQKIGPYDVIGELGRGGMGVVYRARPSGGGADVALKIPFAELSSGFGSMRREIHALSRLRHPGVVRIIESGLEKGVPWYAMELLEAQTLDEILGIVDEPDEVTAVKRVAAPMERGGRITTGPRRISIRSDLSRALTLMYRLARVLTYVHAHGFVHRDLKPRNILVRPGDRPIVTDFGLMGNFGARTGREILEVGGWVMGTAVYLAPEQAKGELVDARADLYAFGVMLYEIVTGRLPFEAPSFHTVVRMHLNDAVPPPSMLVDGVPPALESLILSLLEKEPGNRPGYAEDVAALLLDAGAQRDEEFDLKIPAYLYRPHMIGRESTVASLCDSLDPAKKGRGAFLMLGGESGIGKTSVAAAFAREATMRHFRVVTGECEAIGGQPLHPLRSLFREIAEICRTDPEVLARVLGTRLTTLREQDPVFAALADDDLPRVAPEIAARRLFSDLGETFAAFAREGPLLLVIDDVQWADEVTLRFLASLGNEFFEELPLLILATYRSDEAGPDLRALLAEPHVSTVLLGRLNEENVEEIVRSMLAAPDAPASFLHFLSQTSEGNPFFVAEYLRSAVDERLLIREAMRWRIIADDSTYASLKLPGTILDLVARRLESLSPLARRIAETAAVLGREPSEELLTSVCGVSDAEMLDAVAELVERYVFEELFNGVRFAHDKMREGTYERIDPLRRTQLHARVVEVLESTRSAEELNRDAAVLAHHCDEAGLREKATRYYAQAGENAVRTGACREAVDSMNRAFVLDDRPSNESASERSLRHARWQRLLSQAHFGLGQLGVSVEHAGRSLVQLGLRIPTSSSQWRWLLVTQALRQAVHLLLPRRMFRARKAKGPVLREVVLSAQKLSEGSYYASDFEGMLAAALLAVNTAESLDRGTDIVAGTAYGWPENAYANLGVIASGVGLFRLADRYFDESRRLATATNDLNGLAHHGFTSAVHYVVTCDWDRARLVDQAVAHAHAVGDDQVIEYCQTAKGHVQFYSGALEKSLDTYDLILHRAHKRSSRQHEAWGHLGRARSLVPLGRPQEALAAATRSLELLDSKINRMDEVITRGVLTSALLHMNELDAARAEADRTFVMATEGKLMLWEMFRGLSGPAEVYLDLWSRCGDRRVLADLDARLKLILRGMRGIARRAPIVGPVTLRMTGLTELLRGHAGRGVKLLRTSAAEAARLGVPIDEGIALYELGRCEALGTEERSTLLERAGTIFRNTGCGLFAQKMSAGDPPAREGRSAN